MKIIRVVGCVTAKDVIFHPDSTLLLPGRPFFYPDFGGDWAGELYLAIRLNRLGKGVSVKFAPRYYDALSIALHMLPTESGILPPGVLSGVDNSITHGEWIAPADIDCLKNLIIDGKAASTELPDINYVDSMVSCISRYTTIRTGDLLLLPLGVQPMPLTPRTYLNIKTSDREIINLKIV